MFRLQAALEVGKCLHERSRGRARRGGGLVFGVEVPDEPRETALGGAHRLERDVYYSMSDVVHRVAQFIARERGEIDMRENEFCARDSLVEVCARPREYARAASRFIVCQCEKAGEESESGEHEDEIRHGV